MSCNIIEVFASSVGKHSHPTYTRSQVRTVQGTLVGDFIASPSGTTSVVHVAPDPETRSDLTCFPTRPRPLTGVDRPPRGTTHVTTVRTYFATWY